VRILGMILLEKFPDTHPFACQAGYISGKQSLQFKSFWKMAPDVGIPYRQTSHATAPRKGREADQCFSYLKGTGGHTCEQCYGKYGTWMPFP
ncbi:hypothetical protein HMPREF0971_02129, partial [Segatella oris F0302]